MVLHFFHGACQGAATELHQYFSPRLNLGGSPENPFLREAERDGVATGQHRQGAEAFQPGQATLQLKAALL